MPVPLLVLSAAPSLHCAPRQAAAPAPVIPPPLPAAVAAGWPARRQHLQPLVRLAGEAQPAVPPGLGLRPLEQHGPPLPRPAQLAAACAPQLLLPCYRNHCTGGAGGEVSATRSTLLEHESRRWQRRPEAVQAGQRRLQQLERVLTPCHRPICRPSFCLPGMRASSSLVFSPKLSTWLTGWLRFW